MSYGSNYQGKHDPAFYIVPPTLDRGHSENIQCRIQASHYRALNIVARSGLFPHEERNDVIRWAIKYGLDHLASLEPRLINTLLMHANLTIARAKDDLYQAKLAEAFDELQRGVTMHLGNNDPASVRELVKYYRDQIEKMPEEPERELRWKLRYLDKLEPFRHYEHEEGQ